MVKIKSVKSSRLRVLSVVRAEKRKPDISHFVLNTVFYSA